MPVLDSPQIATSAQPFDFDPDVFRAKFNKERFTFTHHLADNPLFQLPRLLELAKTTETQRRKDLYFDMGDVEIGQRWDQVPASNLTVEESIHRIQNCNAWVILRHANKDPEYSALLNACTSQLLELTKRELEKSLKWKEVILFITSPNRTSSYHIDRECNFLCQIRGSKMIHLFDQHDQEVLPEAEKERFWSVDNNAALYKPQFQDRAFSFQMLPGNGVHIPINAPHWLKNGDDISISLSINFAFQDSDRQHIYRANYLLRKLGMHPTPPFQSPEKDAMKRKFVGSAMSLAKAIPGPVQKAFRKVVG